MRHRRRPGILVSDWYFGQATPLADSTARFEAIDVIRRRARFDGAQRDLVAQMESRVNDAPGGKEGTGDEEIEDDRLRLIFTCCHPALPPEGQVALTLREVCGLTTEEIARAFLVSPSDARPTQAGSGCSTSFASGVRRRGTNGAVPPADDVQAVHSV